MMCTNPELDTVATGSAPSSSRPQDVRVIYVARQQACQIPEPGYKQHVTQQTSKFPND
jgi:hypothetical protein